MADTDFFEKSRKKIAVGVDKPGEGHYTPHQTAATRFWMGD